RVVATAFAPAHLARVSVALTGLHIKVSATPAPPNDPLPAISTCQELYSGCAAPATRTTSPTLTLGVAPVPVIPTVESAFPVPRLTSSDMDPTCTVTVSVLS